MLSKVLPALSAGDIAACIEHLRAWLKTAQPGDPEALLRECPINERGRLSLMLCDLLSRYPTTFVGTPVLMYFKPDIPARITALPFPSPLAPKPCEDLRFLGWLPLRTQTPIPSPFHPESSPVFLKPNDYQGAVALFRSHPEVFDLDEVAIPNEWWDDLFRPVLEDGTLQVSARMLFSYPVALEACRVMLDVAADNEVNTDGLFISDAVWNYAFQAGVMFRETSRRSFE